MRRQGEHCACCTCNTVFDTKFDVVFDVSGVGGGWFYARFDTGFDASPSCRELDARFHARFDANLLGSNAN